MGAGDMAESLRVLAALTRDLASVFNAQVVYNCNVCYSQEFWHHPLVSKGPSAHSHAAHRAQQACL